MYLGIYIWMYHHAFSANQVISVIAFVISHELSVFATSLEISMQTKNR